ncbi:hypothetical protein mflW37_4990 [Mesoplasma florum W37]|uniref:HTH rpiR-type domain-containing protein n=1 Tax=Mesoplasma florum TaxID=2151 RepID=A0AAD0MP33_MESFO|nr:MurR/RpiR family transcriptional regulator [Mesoplasma florum]AGY41566.1 hypothetical protein mflW37_4990 [Mesoplasma florum W37]ATI73437.1 MurR/RpiR family transcriptional regulator [Mesoplasma florum]AVN59777.1 MurR/RpiR family transcriptional regulator [Mesoplasma florum]AVN61830.1 MurR/RpiR family transcriptional regulator [Mesoplasma florum]AVN65904.1 hypothetical protein MflW12_4990 [Mesoplasma florum]
MNIIEKINQNRQFLSPQEGKVCDFIFDNLADYRDFSVKVIAKKANVKESVVTKTLIKLQIGGLKQLRESLDKTYNYFKNESNEYSNLLIEEFENKIITSFSQVKNFIDNNAIELIAKEIVKSQKIILFCTGKTKTLIDFMFFQLLEMGFNVDIFSSPYDSKAYDVADSVVLAISISGRNSKINRYLNLIKNRNPRMILAITSSPIFNSDVEVDYHLHGNENNFFLNDNRANPFMEKYKIQYIVDLLILSIINNADLEKIKFQEKIQTKNLI